MLPRTASCVDNPPAVYRFKSQPDRKRSCNLQIAIELQRSAGHVAPFRVAKIDFDVITDIAAKWLLPGHIRQRPPAEHVACWSCRGGSLPFH